MTLICKDCMSRKLESLSPDTNAMDALKRLIAVGRSGLPVLDKNGAPVGVFTEKEILKAILPSYLKDVGSFVYGDDSKSELKKLSHLDRFLVKDLMRTDVPVVKEDTSLTEVSHIMLTKSERRVIVVRDGKAIGVLTRYDIVRALAEKAGVQL